MYTIIPVNQSNLAAHPQVICFINPKHPTYRLKAEWLAERFLKRLRRRLLHMQFST